ncbi:MAG: glucose-6-phosphate isomerase [Isosphaeraceae bacterium]
MNALDLWKRYQKHVCTVEPLGLTLDISRMAFSDDFLGRMEPAMQRAFAAMRELEAGAIANPDEKRMVGHYWLRTPELAPSQAIAGEIRDTLSAVKSFAADVLTGRVAPPGGGRFGIVLVIGIGGSALGPQFVAEALRSEQPDATGPESAATPEVLFLDNTDPEGVALVLDRIGARLGQTLAVVISKSGGTPETRNGMLLATEAYQSRGLNFARHAVAITGQGSNLDKLAESQGWLGRFPMWDWVGGRTSELSAVGLLPAALQRLDIDSMLAGAAACDAATRSTETATNPAALLALMWYHASGGKGLKDMVVLPYKDRLLLFSRYLQQLVMESLGKRLDLDGNQVDQGLSVYGNKGSTDQHAYVQQLRDGINNFFAVFIRVLEDGGSSLEVEPQVRAGDYLDGFLLGTRSALYENGRESVTITVPRVDARTVGALIALFERAVGLYATLIHVNAYHQPGVEAGKKAAAAVLDLQRAILGALTAEPRTADQLAAVLGRPGDPETVHHICEHLAANGRVVAARAACPGETTYRSA